MTVTIFQIDTSADRENFMAYIKTRPLRGSIAKVEAGTYNIDVIPAFVMDDADYRDFVIGSEFEATDKSRITVTSCNKAYSHLIYADGEVEALGSAHQIDADETAELRGWVYRPDMNAYWTFRKGNPDFVEDIEPERMAA